MGFSVSILLLPITRRTLHWLPVPLVPAPYSLPVLAGVPCSLTEKPVEEADARLEYGVLEANCYVREVKTRSRTKIMTKGCSEVW